MTFAAAQPVVQVGFAGLASGAVYALLALGVVLIYRTTGVLNLAHWAIGLLAVVAYALLTQVGVPPLVAVVLSVPFSIAGGVYAYRLVFRRVPRSAQVIVILIVIGIAQLFSSAAQFALGFQQFTRLPAWLPVGVVHIFGAAVNTILVVTTGTALVVAFGFLVWFRSSRTGRALRAVAQNREAALLAGIDDLRYSSIAWGIGSALAALALLLALPQSAGSQGGVITTFDVTPFGLLLIPAFGAALVGGLVNLPLALAGGFLFGISEKMLVLAPEPWSQIRTTIAGILIVILLLLRTERFFTSRQELEALEA
jgi:branched-chain amino acid transport system permease protein